MAKNETPITEDLVAKAFVRRNRGKIVYVPDVDDWRLFTGSHWASDQKGEVKHRLRLLAREMANQDGSAAAKRSAGRETFVGGALRFAEKDPAFALLSNDFDNDPLLLGTPGGVVDLRTGAQRRARAEDRISKVTGVRAARTEDCPRFKAFLDDATGGDSSLIGFLRLWFGYNLSGLTNEEAMVFIHGPGENGKSKLLDVATQIFGDYATIANTEMFAASKFDRHPAELARLQGARCVTASETEGGKGWAEAKIKTLTGGDPISARYMRQNFFTYRPQFKLTIVGNHEPSLQNVDHALKRRMIIVSFNRRPPNPDKKLLEKLRPEFPAILRWMINGCLEWQRLGLSRPDIVRRGTDQYFERQDVFGRWLEDECELTPDDQSRFETPTALFLSWQRFAEAEGENPGTAKAFAGRLKQRGLCSEKETKGERRYRGIRLNRRTQLRGARNRG